MILQRERQFLRRRFVQRAFAVRGGAGELDVVLYQNAVVKNGRACGTRQLSCRVKTRTVKNNVVGLPFARRTRGVHQRRILAINRRGLRSEERRVGKEWRARGRQYTSRKRR